MSRMVFSVEYNARPVTVGVAINVFEFDFHFVPGLFHLAGLVHRSSSVVGASSTRSPKMMVPSGRIPAIGKPSFCAALIARLIWASVQITRVVTIPGSRTQSK